MASPVSSAHASATAFAIACIIAAGIILAGMDAIAKHLALSLPVLMVVWARYVFHTALTFAAYAARRRSLNFLRARRPGLQFLRASSLFIATSFMYVAITRMPLGDAASIQFLAPVLVTVISGLFLGEQVGPRRIVAVVVAFIGVLFVARPGSDALGFNALLPLATAVFLSLYMVMTRFIRDKDDPDVTTFYTTAVGAVVLSLLVAFSWQAVTPAQWVLMVAMGGAGAAGHYLLVKAYHNADASMLAPFSYSQVVGAILWGYLVFSDVPSLYAAIGAGLIVGSGIYVWYREMRIRKGLG